MKKKSLAVVLLLVMLVLTGCSDPVQDTIDAIYAIGTVTLESQDAIIAAEAKYEALSDEQKRKVVNDYMLQSARVSLDELLEIDAVVQKISAIGSVNSSSGNAITAAENAYKALTSSQKGQVTNYSVLTAARKSYNEAVIRDKKDIAHTIWKDMAKAGNISLTSAWEMQGMYTFGSTTGAGYVTLQLAADDPFVIKGDVSFRIYPTGTSDITKKFLPMLKVLIERLSDAPLSSSDENLFDTMETVLTICKTQRRSYNLDDERFDIGKCRVKIKYDPTHNELYVLLSPTENTNVWQKK